MCPCSRRTHLVTGRPRQAGGSERRNFGVDSPRRHGRRAPAYQDAPATQKVAAWHVPLAAARGATAEAALLLLHVEAPPIERLVPGMLTAVMHQVAFVRVIARDRAQCPP